MADFDVLQPASGLEHGTQISSWLEITWDLLLTSRCIFKSSPNIGDSQNRLLWSKWVRLSDLGYAEDLAPSLYRWSTSCQNYRDGLLAELNCLVREQNAQPLLAATSSLMPSNNTDANLVSFPTLLNSGRDGVKVSTHVRFLSYYRRQLSPARGVARTSFTNKTSNVPKPLSEWVSDKDYIIQRSTPVYSAFSRNAEGKRAVISSLRTERCYHVYIKTADSFAEELCALDHLESFFRKRNLQKCIAIQANSVRIF
ncbi:hypothetical protein GQ44DRAFT_731847 [Phaeosphaeriaceae sp. PMI808]|nr:hypothetical protein GQ44DRAFT_731847 [Phaeosphaeriaceae sp. PMI808]